MSDIKIVREISKYEDVWNILNRSENDDEFVVLFLKKEQEAAFCEYRHKIANDEMYSHLIKGHGILSGVDYIDGSKVFIGEAAWMQLYMFDKILVKIDTGDIHCTDFGSYVIGETLLNYKDSEILKWYREEFGTLNTLMLEEDETKITNQKETKMNNKIGMTYSGEMAVVRGNDYLIYTPDGKLNNVKNAVIEMRTAILEVTKDCLKRGDIILHNDEHVFIDSIDNNITLVSVNGKKFDLIEEMSAGMPSPIYKKIVNPLDSSQIGNPMVAMSMMANGTSMDPVSQMALMNILNGKKEDSRVGKMEESIASMAESIKMLADVVAIAVNKE